MPDNPDLAAFIARVREHRQKLRNAVRIIRFRHAMHAPLPEWIITMNDREWLIVLRRVNRP